MHIFMAVHLLAWRNAWQNFSRSQSPSFVEDLEFETTKWEERMLTTARKERQVTVLEAPHNVVTNSSFGKEIAYESWCQREAQRIRKYGINAFVHTDKKTGGVAVFVG